MKVSPDIAYADMPAEAWAWRLFLAGLFSLTVSITLGQTFLSIAIVMQAVVLVRHRRGWAWSVACWGATAFLAAALLAMLVQPELQRGWSRLSRLRWLLLLPATATFVTEPRRRKHVLTALAAGCTLLALWTLVRNPLNAWRDMQAGEAWAPDFFKALIHEGAITEAQFLMLGLLATLGVLALAGDAYRRRLWRIALALQAVAFVMHFKRGSWICVLPLLLTWTLWRARGKRLWKTLLGLLAVLAIVLALPAVRYRLAQTRQELDTRHGGRLTMWTEVAPGLVRDYPWGIGYGQLDNETMREYAPHVERGRNHLHSNVVQVLVDTGWIGLTVYLLWMGSVFFPALRRVWRQRGQKDPEQVVAMAFLLMFAGLMANGLVEYNFGTTFLMMTLFVIMACLEAGKATGDSMSSQSAVQQ